LVCRSIHLLQATGLAFQKCLAMIPQDLLQYRETAADPREVRRQRKLHQLGTLARITHNQCIRPGG